MTASHRAELDRRMRAILARLELISNGTTTSYNHAGGGGESNRDPLSQNAGKGAPHLHWAREYGEPFMRPTPKHLGARDDFARQAVIQDAEADRQHLTGSGDAVVARPVGESVEERDLRIVDEGHGYTIKEAAIKFRCGERDIRRARTSHGRDPQLGKAPIGTLDSDERKRRARELREQRHSVAAIALLLRVSKATVKRDLRLEEAA